MAEKKKLVNRLETGVERISGSIVNTAINKTDGDIVSKEITRETAHLLYEVTKTSIKVTNATAFLTGAVIIDKARKINNKITGHTSNDFKTNCHVDFDYEFVKDLDKYTVDVSSVLYNPEYRLKNKKSYLHPNYTGLKRVYYKIDDAINGRTETIVKLQQRRFLKNRGDIVVETHKLIGKNKITSKKVGSWEYKKKVLSQKQYNKMMSRVAPDLLQEAVLKGKHNFKEVMHKDASKTIKDVYVAPLTVSGRTLKKYILKDEGTGSKFVATAINTATRFKQVKSTVKGVEAAANFTSRVTVGTAKTAARVAWNTPKVAVKTVKAVAHPVRTTKAVGNAFRKVINNVKKEITKTLTTTVLPYLAGFAFICICIVLVSNTLGTALSFVGQASYSADASSFKVLTETISKLDATYQKHLDTGDFKNLAKHIKNIEVKKDLLDNNFIQDLKKDESKSDVLFSEASKIRININKDLIYSSEQDWDGTISKENWVHLTDSKIHSDRAAFFDYINAKYQDSMKNESNYTGDVDKFLDDELGDEDDELKEEIKEENKEENEEEIEIKEYDSNHVKKDVSDMWGLLQFLDLEVTNENDEKKPIFKNTGIYHPYLIFKETESDNSIYVGEPNSDKSDYSVDPYKFETRTENFKGRKEYPDPTGDGDTRILECDRTYKVTKVNMRFEVTRQIDSNLIYSDPIHDESSSIPLDVNYNYYVTELWQLISGEEHEWCECTENCEHPFSSGIHYGNKWDYSTEESMLIDNYREFYYITNNNGISGFINVKTFNDYFKNGAIKAYEYSVDLTKEYYIYEETPNDSYIGNTEKIFRKVTFNNDYYFNCCEEIGHSSVCENRKEGYIFEKYLTERKTAITNAGLSDYIAFQYEYPVPKFGATINEWTGYYEQIYKCKETHTSMPLRWRLSDDEDLEEAMTLDDRTKSENENAIELYNAFLEFESNLSSAIVGNVFKDKIVSIKRENGYRYDETKNDIVKKELEVYSESGWEVFTPMSGKICIEKPFDDDEEYLIIEGDIEWDMGYDPSVWKNIKDGIVKFFTNKEPAPCPYRVPRLYLRLSDINLAPIRELDVNNARDNKDSPYLMNGSILGTCTGETLHIIPTYLKWDGKEFEIQDYDLNCYMENIAMSIGAINKNRLSRDSVGYKMLELAEKYKEYNYYYGEATDYQIQQLKIMSGSFLKNTRYYNNLQQIVNGDGEISFSNIGLIRKVLNEMKEDGYDIKANLDALIIPNDMRLLSKSVNISEIKTGDFIMFMPKSESEIKYVGIVADPINHTMLIQEDAFSQYVHYANWNDSQWGDYSISFGRIDIESVEKTETEIPIDEENKEN